MEVIRMNNKPIICIVGRSGAGKDTLANHFAELYGWKQVISATTRPRRYPTENTHLFVSEVEAAGMKDRVAETVINGYQYFATREMLEEAEMYIIDPKGIGDICQHSDIPITVIYVRCDTQERCRRARLRGDNVERELKVFWERHNSEDAEFSAFEQLILEQRVEEVYPNVNRVVVYDSANNAPGAEEVKKAMVYSLVTPKSRHHYCYQTLRPDVILSPMMTSWEQVVDFFAHLSHPDFWGDGQNIYCRSHEDAERIVKFVYDANLWDCVQMSDCSSGEKKGWVMLSRFYI
jgi:guanylate kinase